MGVCPCLNRDPAEKMIMLKEQSLMLDKFAIVQIKDAFFNLNDTKTITYNNIIKGMQKLTAKAVDAESLYKGESEALKNFQALLKGVIDGEVDPDIKKNTFKFKPLMIMLILLCKSISKDKIQEILRMEGKPTFNPESLAETLGEIFKTVVDCSLHLLTSEMDPMKHNIESKKFNLYKKNIAKVVENSVVSIFHGSTDKNPVELGYMFYQLVGSLKYDAASTNGIRKILKDSVPKEEKLEAEKGEESTKKQPEAQATKA